MPRKPPQTYNVHRAQDGAQIIAGVPFDVARSEAARLNAEARVIAPETGQPTGMYLGEVVRYEVRSAEGIALP